jgi:two-component system OmpR family sensor kinase
VGRLFWKFFFSFWLTLLLAALSAGSLVWLKRAADADSADRELWLLDYRGIPYVMVAADIAEQQGMEALSSFIEKSQADGLNTILAVDENGRDLLNRPVDAETLEQAKTLLDKGKRKIVNQVEVNGSNILLYSPLAEPKPAKYRHHKKGGRLPLFLIITSAIFASLLFSAVLAWYFTRPIRSLREAFQAVARGKLETRVSDSMARRNDELAELGQNFDYMTGQISALVNGQRHLLHDVSHELRSPLARMQAAIGIAQQQPDKVDVTLNRLEKEAERMSDLVGELLLLSRMETGISHNQPADVDITLLLDEIVADARFEAEAKSVSITYQPNGQISLHGQQELLHRAIENVLRNAIKFSEAGDSVSVEAGSDSDGQRFQIRICDQGPGVAEAELEQLFRPFFRGQQQRRDGVGLGLTIAQRAVAAHRGTIEATNQVNGGLCMTISLPIRTGR